MALVELEMTDGRFRQFLALMLSAAPIPAPDWPGLAEGQLITGLEWGQSTLGPIPGGSHLLPVRVSLKIRHISIAELEADPAAPEHVTEATASLMIGITGTVLSAGMSRIEIAGAPPHVFPVRQELWTLDLQFDDSVKILTGSILSADAVVTLRLTTNGLDNLTSPPSNRIKAPGQTPEHHMMVRVSGEAIAELLTSEMWKAMDPPPAGTRLEETPRSFWGNWAPALVEPIWQAVGNCAVEKPDGCPGGIFGGIDVSIDITTVLSVRVVDMAEGGKGLELTLSLSGDASDWDVFRCWLGTGGLGALFFGATVNPVLGIVVGVIGMAAIGEITRGVVRDKITEGDDAPARFTKIDTGDDDRVAYRRVESLKFLGRLIGMETHVGQDGLRISGDILILPAERKPWLSVPQGPLAGAWTGGQYNCATQKWEPGDRYTLPVISVAGQAVLGGEKLWDLPTRIFGTTTVLPEDKWALMRFTALERPPNPQVMISTKGPAAVGTSGRLYLHTNVGLFRYDIPPIEAAPTATPEQITDGKIRCAKQTVRANRELGDATRLATSLIDLAGLLGTARRHTEAIMAVTEAVSVYQAQAAAHPEDVTAAYQHAWALLVLAQRFDSAGRRPEAAAPAGRAIDLLFELTPRIEGSRDDLVFDLIAQVGHNSGYLADGVDVIERAVPVAERLAARHPNDLDHAYRHTWILIVLAQRLDRAGRRPEAAGPAAQAIDLLLKLAPSLETTREDLVFDLIAQIGHSSGYLPPADAVAAVERAVGIATRLVARHPGDVAYTARLAWIQEVLRQRQG